MSTGIIVNEVYFHRVPYDREIRLDNGWKIKIGRGLDFYQRPEDRLTIGANDLELRRCLETSVDIFNSLSPRNSRGQIN